MQRHKEFIIEANNVINNVNETEKTNNLVQNIDKHLFVDKPLFECLIAEVDGVPVGMILYSYFYWANDGQVLWVSQMYIKQEYRKCGVFFKLINKLKEENSDIHIISCATGNENVRMNRILEGYGAKHIDLKFYYKKI
jgi:GNAT superfamily N-acetyltransferase